MALEVIRRAGIKNREAMLWHASHLKDFDGALGVWSFDKNGDISMQVMSGNIVKDGKFKFLVLNRGPGANKVTLEVKTAK